MKRNQKGFSAIELIIVLAIAALIGVVGFMVYRNHHKISTGLTTARITPDPYAGWKTYAIPDEQLSFKYPGDWKLTNKSLTDVATLILTSPNSESVTQNGRTSNLYYEIHFSTDGSTDFPIDGQVVAKLPIKVGNSTTRYFLDTMSYTSTDEKGSDFVHGLYLTDKTAPVGQSVTAVNFSSHSTSSVKRALYANLLPTDAQNNGSEILAVYKAHPDYQNLIKIFQSLSY